MKKRILSIIVIAVLAMLLAGCTVYTCVKCKSSTTKAYYDMSADIDRVMCEDCARSYWTPFPYENYRVK